MRRVSWIFAFMLLPTVSPAQELPAPAAAVLKQIKAADTDLLAVSEEDGRFMRLLVAATRSTRALEIGTASGYSAIWIGLGLRETGGHLVTIEYDKPRARQAVDNIKKAGRSSKTRGGSLARKVGQRTGWITRTPVAERSGVLGPHERRRLRRVRA